MLATGTGARFRFATKYWKSVHLVFGSSFRQQSCKRNMLVLLSVLLDNHQIN